MSLSKIIYPHCFALVQSRKTFEHDWKTFGNLIFQIFAVKTLCSRNWHVNICTIGSVLEVFENSNSKMPHSSIKLLGMDSGG